MLGGGDFLGGSGDFLGAGFPFLCEKHVKKPSRIYL